MLMLGTHNIKHLGLIGVQAFVFQTNFSTGEYKCAPKTQPFHTANRYGLF
jgi:hypothetical protein